MATWVFFTQMAKATHSLLQVDSPLATKFVLASPNPIFPSGVSVSPGTTIPSTQTARERNLLFASGSSPLANTGSGDNGGLSTPAIHAIMLKSKRSASTSSIGSGGSRHSLISNPLSPTTTGLRSASRLISFPTIILNAATTSNLDTAAAILAAPLSQNTPSGGTLFDISAAATSVHTDLKVYGLCRVSPRHIEILIDHAYNVVFTLSVFYRGVGP